MLNFIPPPSDKRKKRDKDDLPDDGEQEVSRLLVKLLYRICPAISRRAQPMNFGSKVIAGQ